MRYGDEEVSNSQRLFPESISSRVSGRSSGWHKEVRKGIASNGQLLDGTLNEIILKTEVSLNVCCLPSIVEKQCLHARMHDVLYLCVMLGTLNGYDDVIKSMPNCLFGS